MGAPDGIMTIEADDAPYLLFGKKGLEVKAEFPKAGGPGWDSSNADVSASECCRYRLRGGVLPS